jgi:Zn-dependent protease with chaperone function
VTEESYPTLYRQVKDCCKVLDCPMPEVFVTYDVYFNAFTAGVGKTFVVINNAAVNEYSEEEMRFLIGHELGHIKAGHVLYLTLAQVLFYFMPLLNQVLPFNIGMFQLPLLAALYEWRRRAEFTADRAGLLCAQDPGVAMGQLSSFCGRTNSLIEEHNIDALVGQVKDVRETDNPLAKAMLFFYSMQASHPYPVLRLEKLREWVESGAYARIIGGNYERDEEGEHELGRRIPCDSCGKMVNFKLDKCPHCGRGLWDE